MTTWQLIEGDLYAIALCSFVYNKDASKRQKHMLTFKLGDRVKLKAQCNDWYFGHLIKDSSKSGAFPKNYVQTYDEKDLIHNDQTLIEIDDLLRDWTLLWARKYEDIESKRQSQILMGYFKNLVSFRHGIITNRYTIDELKSLKKTTCEKILRGNHILGLDIIAFDHSYNRLDPLKSSTIRLYEELRASTYVNADASTNAAQPVIHQPQQIAPAAPVQSVTNLERSQFYSVVPTPSTQSMYGTMRKASIQQYQQQNHHHHHHNQQQQQQQHSNKTYAIKLYPTDSHKQLIAMLFGDNNNGQMHINLFHSTNPENSYLCSTAVVELKDLKDDLNNPRLNPVVSASSSTVFFCDLNESDCYPDMGRQLYLAVYFVKNVKFATSNDTVNCIVAGGVTDLTSSISSLIRQNGCIPVTLVLSEFEVPVVHQNNFLKLRDLNINKDTSRTRNREQMHTVQFRCDVIESTYKKIIDQFNIKEFDEYKVNLSRKMHFPDIVMHDDHRNDFYITLNEGVFNKSKVYEITINLVQFVPDNKMFKESNVELLDEQEYKDALRKFDEMMISKNNNNNQNNKDNTINKELAAKFESIRIQLQRQRYFNYKSIVYQKSDRVKWIEVVKISIPRGMSADKIKNMYVRFLVRTRTPISENKDTKTKLYGVAYLKITNEDGSAISDSNNIELFLHKLEENDHLSMDQNGFISHKKSSYPDPPLSSIVQVIPGQNNTSSNKDTLRIKVNVVSTELAQNSAIVRLLAFSHDNDLSVRSYEDLKYALQDVLEVRHNAPGELVKSLVPLFNKLIQVICDLKDTHPAYTIHTNEIQPLIFKVLISIFQIIETQNRYSSFRQVINEYLKNDFCIVAAHKPLFRLFKTNMENLYDSFSMSNLTLGKTLSSKQSSEYIEMIKSIEYIFKFAFQSRDVLTLIFKNHHIAPSTVTDDTFKTDVEDVFTILTKITTELVLNNQQQHYSTNSDTSSISLSPHISTKTTGDLITTLASPTYQRDVVNSAYDTSLMNMQFNVLKSVVKLLPLLTEAGHRFELTKIAKFYSNFLKNRYCLGTQFLLKVIKSKLFESVECRRILMDPLCQNLSNYLTVDVKDDGEALDKRKRAGEFLGKLMDILERKDIGSVSEDVHDLCKLLPPLMFTTEQSQSSRSLYATIIVSIFRLMDKSHFDRLFDYIEKKQNEVVARGKPLYNLGEAGFIQLSFEICKILMHNDTYHNKWSDLLVLRNHVILNALKCIAIRLSKFHLNNFDRVNQELWGHYFDTMVCLITDPCLKLEDFLETKRNCIITRYADMRVKGTMELKDMWFSLGHFSNKQYFTPQLMDSFIKVALIPNNEICTEMIQLFFDMMNSELYLETERQRFMNNSVVIEFEKLKVPNKLINVLDTELEHEGDYGFRDTFARIFRKRFETTETFSRNLLFVDKTVNLINILIEYRELKANRPPEELKELKTFYLNELMNFYRGIKRHDLYLKYVKILLSIHKHSMNFVCAAHLLKQYSTLLNWSDHVVDESIKYKNTRHFANVLMHKEYKERTYYEIIDLFTKGEAWENAFELSKELRDRYERQFEYEKLHNILDQESRLCKNMLEKKRLHSVYYLVGFYGKSFPSLLQNRQFVFRGKQCDQIGSFWPMIESWFTNPKRISHSNPPTNEELESNDCFIQVIQLKPVHEKNFNLSPKLMEYYLNNEIRTFKHTYRRDAKVNEQDPTQWWVIERSLVINETLPNVIDFYPVIKEEIVEINPIESAITEVNKRLNELENMMNELKTKGPEQIQIHSYTSYLNGTIDAGVNGGFPKYQVFFTDDYIKKNPNFEPLIKEFGELIKKTITVAELVLHLFIKQPCGYTELFNVLETQQLPKLKNIFNLQMLTHKEREDLLAQRNVDITNTTTTVNSLHPPSNYTSQMSSISSTSLYSYDSTPPKKHSLSEMSSSYVLNNNKLHKTKKDLFLTNRVANSSVSQRNSVASGRSNSEDDLQKPKIELNEKLIPQRPQRPNRVSMQNSSSSGCNSSHGSRPISQISHASDDNGSTSQLSLLPNELSRQDSGANLSSLEIPNITINSASGGDGGSGSTTTSTPTIQSPLAVVNQNGLHQTPPPKPPKPLNLKLNITKSSSNQ